MLGEKVEVEHKLDLEVSSRPPTVCAGCPHRRYILCII